MDKTHGKVFRDAYVLSKIIGNGNFSVVRQCRHKHSKSISSAKIMTVKGSNDERAEMIDMIRVEISVMRKLKHEFILPFIDAFFESEKVIIITELSEYGDLHDYLVDNADKLSGPQIRLFVLHVSSAVTYMHSLSIAHRDIKPENFLLFKNKEDKHYTLKVCDFGLAEEVQMYGGLTRICGSPSFVAPEILQRKSYGLLVDIWSMGIVFYYIFSQTYPFSHIDTNVMFDQIMKSDFEFYSPKWKNVSDSAKELISLMLQKNPKKRITASEILRHSWFHEKLCIDSSVLSNRKRVTFKTAALVVTGSSILQKCESRSPRENAIISPEMLEGIKIES